MKIHLLLPDQRDVAEISLAVERPAHDAHDDGEVAVAVERPEVVAESADKVRELPPPQRGPGGALWTELPRGGLCLTLGVWMQDKENRQIRQRKTPTTRKNHARTKHVFLFVGILYTGFL